MLQFLKMYPVLQASLLGTPLNSFSGRLPKWGTYSNGAIWPLQTLGHPTAVPAGSVWPTARARDYMQQSVKMAMRFDTPGGMDLTNAVRFHWSTPQTRDYRSPDKPDSIRAIRKAKQGWSQNLNDQAAWATPTKQDGENNAGPSQFLRNSQPQNVQAAGKAGGKLNPDWVEALMGFPIGWTNIAGPPVPDNRNTHGNRRASWKARRNIVLPASRHSAMRLSHRSSTRLHAKLWRGYKRRKALQND